MAKMRLFPGWWVVLGSGVGIAFGSAVFLSATFALLASAIAADFGWTQSELANAATLFLLLQMVAYPLCGWALDVWGSRYFAVASIAMFAIGLLLLSRISNSLTQFYLAFTLMGLTSAGTNVVSYARAMTLWFDRKRGLALGLAAGCQALGALTMPNALQWIIAHAGWHSAVAALAAFEIIVCAPLVALLVKDSPAPHGLAPDGETRASSAVTAALGTADLRETLRSSTFWKLAIAFAIIGMSFYALATDITFVLTKSAGLSPAQIASLQGFTGLSVLAGRVGFGFLLDRVHAPFVAVATVCLAAACFAIYATTGSHAWVLAAAICIGAAIGGESDLLPYLAGRYFGKASVSKLFGWFLCAFFIGAAIGPVAFARGSSVFGGASTPLYILAFLQVIPAALFLTLGPYAELAARRD